VFILGLVFVSSATFFVLQVDHVEMANGEFSVPVSVLFFVGGFLCSLGIIDLTEPAIVRIAKSAFFLSSFLVLVGCANRFDPIRTIPQSPPEQQEEKRDVVPEKEKKYEKWDIRNLALCIGLTTLIQGASGEQEKTQDRV
jgi:hypothetical protein